VSPEAKRALVVALIFSACAAPIVLGTAAYYLQWGTPATANYGELLSPRSLEGATFQALRGKWVLVTFDAAACGAQCEKKLYVVRQVRRAQGAGAERIERLWLVADDGTPRAQLRAAIEGTHIEPISRAGGAEASFQGNRAEHIYLVDPLGNLMMRYPGDPEPAKMIKDLERLLKVSRVG
jgi:cytochrome oxidase Cu insertion factor (SCO1/SenC/PrrC family)